MNAGPKEMEIDGQEVEDEDIHSKDVDPRSGEKEKHERSTESTIHTVWEFLQEGFAQVS